MGISNVNLSNIKTGKVRAIRFSTLKRLVEYYSVSRVTFWNMKKRRKCKGGDEMEWIREPMEVNMTKSVSWCPCMGAKCRGNNPPFCSIKTSNCKSVQTERLKQALQKAETVIIGAGAGLSTSAGFTYSGELLKSGLAISDRCMDFRICIPGAFSLIKHWKNIGRTGADISICNLAGCSLCLHK